MQCFLMNVFSLILKTSGTVSDICQLVSQQAQPSHLEGCGLKTLINSYVCILNSFYGFHSNYFTSTKGFLTRIFL